MNQAVPATKSLFAGANIIELPMEYFNGEARMHRREFTTRLKKIRQRSETAYHEALLRYFPQAEKAQGSAPSPAERIRGVWYTDSHFLCRRSDAAPLLHSLHNVLGKCSYAVSVGDEWDFGWSEVSNPVKRAIDYKMRLADRYPNCTFYNVLGNHDGAEEYIQALESASAQLPNLRVQRYALKLGRHLFTHGDCVHWSNPTLETINKYRDTYNNGWKPNLAERAFERLTTSLGLHCHVPAYLLEFLLPRKIQAERIISFVNCIDPDLLCGVRNICFGHTHKAFKGFEYGGYRFINGGSHEKGFRHALHRFSVKSAGEELSSNQIETQEIAV